MKSQSEIEVDRAALHVVSCFLEEELDLGSVGEMLESADSALDVSAAGHLVAVADRANEMLGTLRQALTAGFVDHLIGLETVE